MHMKARPPRRWADGAQWEAALGRLEPAHPGIARFHRRRLLLLRVAFVLRVLLNAVSAFVLVLIGEGASAAASVISFFVAYVFYRAMTAGGWKVSLLLLFWGVSSLVQTVPTLPLFLDYVPWFQAALVFELLGDAYFLGLGAWLCFVPKHRRYAQELSRARRDGGA